MMLGLHAVQQHVSDQALLTPCGRTHATGHFGRQCVESNEELSS